MEIGLLILRLAVGLTMAAHGSQKLFGWFGGHGVSGTGGYFEQLGFRPGRFHATLAGLSEFVGGLLLALGFLTPLGAAALIAVMVTAIASVHVKKGFFMTEGGFEYNLLIIASSLALAFSGPGPLSLDYLLNLRLAGWNWGIIALVLGVGGGLLTFTARRVPPRESEQPLDKTA